VSTPTLSVTVTNYNYARYLDQNLSSIRRQSFDDFELIVVDNASNDGSLDVIRDHASVDSRLRVIAHEENRGMFASLRESVELCRGRYRVHVDADDFVLTDDAFEQQVRSLEEHPDMAFTYSSLTMVDPNDQLIFVSRPYPGDTVVDGGHALERVLTFALNHSGMMFRLDAYRATDGYPDRYPHVADMLLAGRLCAVGDVGYIDRQLYGFRKHGENLHLRPEAHVMRDEILPVIDEAFAVAGGRLPDAAAARRRVVRNALVHLPTQYVFSGQRRIGWRLLWESAKLHPYDTIVQRRTLVLLARTVLGARGYGWLIARVRPPADENAPVPAAIVTDWSST
jgi:glycosyltransferase involved in cell wall biosynthesis